MKPTYRYNCSSTQDTNLFHPCILLCYQLSAFLNMRHEICILHLQTVRNKKFPYWCLYYMSVKKNAINIGHSHVQKWRNDPWIFRWKSLHLSILSNNFDVAMWIKNNLHSISGSTFFLTATPIGLQQSRPVLDSLQMFLLC